MQATSPLDPMGTPFVHLVGSHQLPSTGMAYDVVQVCAWAAGITVVAVTPIKKMASHAALKYFVMLSKEKIVRLNIHASGCDFYMMYHPWS